MQEVHSEWQKSPLICRPSKFSSSNVDCIACISQQQACLSCMTLTSSSHTSGATDQSLETARQTDYMAGRILPAASCSTSLGQWLFCTGAPIQGSTEARA